MIFVHIQIIPICLPGALNLVALDAVCPLRSQLYATSDPLQSLPPLFPQHIPFPCPRSRPQEPTFHPSLILNLTSVFMIMMKVSTQARMRGSEGAGSSECAHHQLTSTNCVGCPRVNNLVPNLTETYTPSRAAALQNQHSEIRVRSVGGGPGVVIAHGYFGLTTPNVLGMLVYAPPRRVVPLTWALAGTLLECGSCLVVLGSKGVLLSTLTLGLLRRRRQQMAQEGVGDLTRDAHLGVDIRKLARAGAANWGWES